jgi:hypothetical protein
LPALSSYLYYIPVGGKKAHSTLLWGATELKKKAGVVVDAAVGFNNGFDI